MILDKIVNAKKLRLEKDKLNLSLGKIIKSLENNLPNSPSFYDAIKKEGLSIIGEIKKASPSKGIIKEDFNPIEIAKEYERAVDCLSILTEQDFFLGDPKYIPQVVSTVSLPILRKDFIIDEYQIYEAKFLGASSVLLICAILTVDELKRYIHLAKSLKLTPLVEVHDEKELNMALQCEAPIIGVNNRNLKDFSVDLNTTIKLSEKIPKDILLVSESGISETSHITALKQANINGILVGESFMRCNNIKLKSKEFKKAYEG